MTWRVLSGRLNKADCGGEKPLGDGVWKAGVLALISSSARIRERPT